MTASSKQLACAWLRDRCALDGVLAVGAGFADKTVSVIFAAPEFILAQNEEIWTCIGDALPRLQGAGAGVAEIQWRFEGGTLWTALRLDGAWTGVFMPLEATPELIATLQRQFATFRGANFTPDSSPET